MIDDSIIESLQKLRVEGNTAYLPTEVLDNYPQVKRVLQNAGATYRRNAFIFPGDAATVFSKLITGTAVNPKQEFQQFFTPDRWADYIVELAQLQDGMSILEPEAGDGQLIRAIYRKFPRIMEGPNDDPCVTVDYYELLAENRESISRWLHSDEKALSRTSDMGAVLLQVKAPTSNHDRYDRVIMNPPFTKNLDIAHIRHAWEFVRPGGKLLSYCSGHPWISSNKIGIAFREFVSSYGYSIPVEDGAFKESGTNVKTRVVVLGKK